MLAEERRLKVRGPATDAPLTRIPARLREIVTKNLKDSGMYQFLLTTGLLSRCSFYALT